MNSAVDSSTIRKPVIHHLHELQKRLLWSVLALIAGSSLAYSVNGWLLEALRAPLGETLYYTSPMGGFSFLLKVCVAVGFVIALPIILYNIFAFLGPLLRKHHRLTIIAFTLWSFDLAYLGILFAYFVSLPSALHFLSQFGGQSIQSLITVNEYFNFALAYLAGFAMIFQVPLIVLFINRIKPLKPKGMIGAQRYIILFSFIAAAILTPTPDPVNQAIMALPAIVLYQVGIILVWVANREKKRMKRQQALKVAPQSIRPHAQDIHKKQHKTTARSFAPMTPALMPSKKSIAPAVAPVAPQRPVRRATRQSIDGFTAPRTYAVASRSSEPIAARRPEGQIMRTYVQPT